MFEALRGLGYDGGYDAVRRYARVWQRDRAATSVDAFIPLSFAPSEAYQFDSHEHSQDKSQAPELFSASMA